MYVYTSVEFTSDELDLQDGELLPDREALSIANVGNFFGPNVNIQSGSVLNSAGFVGGNSTQVGVVSIG